MLHRSHLYKHLSLIEEVSFLSQWIVLVCGENQMK